MYSIECSAMSLEYCDLYSSLFSASAETPIVVSSVKKFDINEAVSNVRTLLNTKAKNCK